MIQSDDNKLSILIAGLPDETKAQLFEERDVISKQFGAFEIDIRNEFPDISVDRKLAKSRTLVRRKTRDLIWQRTLEVLQSYITMHLNIRTESTKTRATLASLDENFMEIDKILRDVKALGIDIDIPSPPAPSSEESTIQALAAVERRFQKARMSLLNPFRLCALILKLELSYYSATGRRLLAMTAFGISIFLAAGMVHKFDLEAGYVALIAVPLAVSIIELWLHHLGSRYFERWAHLNRIQTNRLLRDARIRIALNEAVAEGLARRSADEINGTAFARSMNSECRTE